MWTEPNLFIAHQAAFDMVIDALPRRRYYGTGTDWAANVMYNAAMATQVPYALQRVTQMRSAGQL